MQRAALDLGVTSSAPISRILRIATTADRSDIYGIWVGEEIGRGCDVFAQASITMLKAPSKNLGLVVASPIVRNITTIARAAASLREIDPARFRLGLGVGQFALQDLARLGLTVEKPVTMLRDAVSILRRIWAGETLTFKTGIFDLRQLLARYRPGFRIPLYLNVRAPKLLRLAARIADGVILSGPLAYLEKAIAIVRDETHRRSARSTLRIVVWVPALVVRTRTDRQLAKVAASTAIAGTPPNVTQMAEISEDAAERVRRTTRERGYRAASRYVTEELLQSFVVSADARHISQVFHSLVDLGAHEIVFAPLNGRRIIRSIREVIEAWERL